MMISLNIMLIYYVTRSYHVIYHMEGTLAGEMLANLTNDHKFAKFSPTKFYALNIISILK